MCFCWQYKAAEKQELNAFQHVCGENSLTKYSEG